MGDFRFSVNEPGSRISTVYTPVPVRSSQLSNFTRSANHLTGNDVSPRIATPSPSNVSEAIRRQQQPGSGLVWTNIKDRETSLPAMKFPVVTGRPFPEVQVSVKNNRQGSSRQRVLGTMRQDNFRRSREPEVNDRYRPSSSLSSPWLASHVPGINKGQNEGLTVSLNQQPRNNTATVRNTFGNNPVGDHNKALAWTRSLGSGGRTRTPSGGVYLSSGYGLNDRIRERPPPLAVQRSNTFSFHFPIRSVEPESRPQNDYYRGKPRVGHFRFTSSSDTTPNSETSDTDTSSDVTTINREFSPVPRAVMYRPNVNPTQYETPSVDSNGSLRISLTDNSSDGDRSFQEDMIVPSSPLYTEKPSQHLNDISSNTVQSPAANYSQFSPEIQDMLNKKNLSMSDYFSVSVSDYDTDTGSNFSVSTLQRSNSELDSRMLTSARRRKRKEKKLSVRFNMCNQVHEYEPTRNSPHYIR